MVTGRRNRGADDTGHTRPPDPSREVARGLQEVALPLVVAAGLFVVGPLLLFGSVHYPLGLLELEGSQREGIELIIPLVVLAGAVLLREYEFADPISPRQAFLGLLALVGGSLILVWTWSEPFLGYHPLRLAGAGVLAYGFFVVGRYHFGTSAVVLGALGPTALIAPVLMFVGGASCGYGCEDAVVGFGMMLWVAALLVIVGVLVASAKGKNGAVHGASWVSLIFTMAAAWGYLLGYGAD